MVIIEESTFWIKLVNVGAENVELNVFNVDVAKVNPTLKERVAAMAADFFKKTGNKLIITSGYRSPERNAKVGGAKNSAHLRGNAVDVSTNGMSTNDKIKLIQIASAVGIGGIGAYSSGGIHFDVEGRRGWGDGFHREGIPDWAKGVIGGHIQGIYLGGLGNIQPVEQSPSLTTPTSQTPTPIPTQERKITSSGGNTVILNSNQAAVSIVKKQINPSNEFRDLAPLDIINSGIRGY